jgi:hypothetical protein
VLDVIKSILKRCWQLLLGLLLGIIAVLGFLKPKTKPGPKPVADATDIEKDLQDEREKKADENEKKAEELDERLDNLKRRRKTLSIFLLVLLLPALMCGRLLAADEPALPSDYVSLQRLYVSALEQIQALKGDLDEAIEIAEGYKALYESERRLRFEAEDAVLRGLTREDRLQELINEQHRMILELTTRKRLNFSLGALYLNQQPGLFAGITF